MRAVAIAYVGISLLLATTGPVLSQGIPKLNVDPVCHGIARQSAAPSERGGPDLAFSQCVKSEQAMRQRLVKEWPTFVVSEKTSCIEDETSAQYPSYTDLVTCLEMARAARALNAPSK
jgi:hypothetical protein